jgi:hypothetical protein
LFCINANKGSAVDLFFEPNINEKELSEILLGSKNHLQKVFLQKILLENEISQASLCRYLAIKAPQMSSWNRGTESIPHQHILTISEFAKLSKEDFFLAILISEITNELNTLLRFFEKKEAILKKYFNNSLKIHERLINKCSKLIIDDDRKYKKSKFLENIYIHIKAAHRVCHDLSIYLHPNNESFTLFNPENIKVHLQHPHHNYMGFFISEISSKDGAEVKVLIEAIYKGLDACIDLISTGVASNLQVAQHALHLVSRYRGDSVRKYLSSKNVETRRMVLFGEVYRNFDSGLHEMLINEISKEPEMSAAVFRFDSYHYKDGLNESLNLSKLKFPFNALSRFLIGLDDENESIRSLSLVRIKNILMHIESRFIQDEKFIVESVNLKSLLTSHVPKSVEEEQVLDKIKKIVEGV